MRCDVLDRSSKKVREWPTTIYTFDGRDLTYRKQALFVWIDREGQNLYSRVSGDTLTSCSGLGI
jgi:hypothetical protein